jgi:hypothetical protein
MEGLRSMVPPPGFPVGGSPARISHQGLPISNRRTPSVNPAVRRKDTVIFSNRQWGLDLGFLPIRLNRSNSRRCFRVIRVGVST